MNPFLHSTVARVSPLHHRCASRWNFVPCPAVARRSLRQALGIAAVATALLAPSAVSALDINSATAAQLEAVRGIGPRTAEIIVRERDRGGKFESAEDLAERVRGIGLKKAQALQSAGLEMGDNALVASKPSSRSGMQSPGPTQTRRSGAAEAAKAVNGASMGKVRP